MTNAKNGCDRKIAVVVDIAGHKSALYVHKIGSYMEDIFRGLLLAVYKCSKTNSKSPPQKQDEVVKRFYVAMFGPFIEASVLTKISPCQMDLYCQTFTIRLTWPTFLLSSRVMHVTFG